MASALTMHPDWPVLRTFDAAHLARIALPLGGIGTGTVSLGGRGDLRDWEVANRPAKGFTPPGAFFALWVKPAGGPPVTRVIEGPIDAGDYEGQSGCRAANHSLPRFRDASFAAAYPLGQVLLSDPGVPVAVRIEAFNPLIPPDADASGIPVAVLRFVLVNRTRRRVAASVCGSLPNFIGADQTDPPAAVNRFRTAAGRARIAGVFLAANGLDPQAEAFGTMSLATTAGRGASHRTAWGPRQWGADLLGFWDDFAADGRVGAPAVRAGEQTSPGASLAVRVGLGPRAVRAVTFLLTWHFPNRMTWTPARGESCPDGACADPADRIGNHYATRYAEAWDVAVKTAPALKALEARTVRFVRAIACSELPATVAEAALSNLAALRTQTSFRDAGGRFFGWEGCCDRAGCCHGSCTHVWNYDQATPLLFGGLARSMRDTEFTHATRDDGHMSFRVHLPLSRARDFGLAAADGQMGCLMKLHRDWRLSGDDAFLRRLWPMAKKALQFAWIPGGWDADRDGVMEGCQHNTMDVEYYGPNPQVGVIYLGALRAAENMARHLGEADLADTCRDLFIRGSRWIARNLFNGQYYEQQVRPEPAPEAIAPGLRHASMGAADPADPDFQIGPGCEANQVLGQLWAHLAGLGDLLPRRQVRSALASLVRHNFRADLSGHFNPLRTYALGDEAGLLMCTWPRGGRPARPYPYASEVWTGLEYVLAAHLMLVGRTRDGLRIVAAVRSRHDGRKRNPFNEPECGHHYARALASWAMIPAMTGFAYDGVSGRIEFAAAAKRRTDFWSNGSAWGTCVQRPAGGRIRVELNVLGGRLDLRELALAGAGSVVFKAPRTLAANRTLRATIRRD